MKQITILMFVLYSVLFYGFFKKEQSIVPKKNHTEKKHTKKRVDSLKETKPINNKQKAYFELLYNQEDESK